MIVKVCGITDIDQFKWLDKHEIDMIGLNFYPKSKRYIEQLPLRGYKTKSKKVGVFVNPSLSEVLSKCKEFYLDMVQLHGYESAEFCDIIAHEVPVIKAFGINDDFDFAELEPYLELATYFLFDTKSSGYGGSGKKFKWEKLNEYKFKTPFLLSGGITLKDIPQILGIDHSSLAGIDVNSGFEKSPGIKNLKNIELMMKLINNEKSR